MKPCSDQAGATVSALLAPRAPSDFSAPVVVSRFVWCSISAFSSAPMSTMVAEIQIHVMKPIPVQLHKNYYETALKDRGFYIDDYDKIRQMFVEPVPASLIYFYCHGTTTQLEFDKSRKPISADNVTGEPYPGWPVIFLNACEAGNISPLAFYTFRRKFQKKKAFGVIAPSFPVPTLFAALFAKRVMGEYIDRRPLGDILIDLRRELLKKKNPLGLWYSLQCPLDVVAPER